MCCASEEVRSLTVSLPQRFLFTRRRRLGKLMWHCEHLYGRGSVLEDGHLDVPCPPAFFFNSSEPIQIYLKFGYLWTPMLTSYMSFFLDYADTDFIIVVALVVAFCVRKCMAETDLQLCVC